MNVRMTNKPTDKLVFQTVYAVLQVKQNIFHIFLSCGGAFAPHRIGSFLTTFIICFCNSVGTGNSLLFSNNSFRMGFF